MRCKDEVALAEIPVETWYVGFSYHVRTEKMRPDSEGDEAILGIVWPNVITNEELWATTGQEDVETTIKRRKWKWIGHTLRKVPNNTTRMAMEWKPQGMRSRGRPKQSW